VAFGPITSTTPVVEEVPVSIVQSSFAGKYTSQDSLYKLIQYHLPIASGVEKITIDNQLVYGDLTMLQSFFYSFWYKRNPEDPESAFRDYEVDIKYVKSHFETKQKEGWRTDRGRVYLQYGAPKTMIVRNNDPDYWPFEIWHYYETRNNLHDRRVLFYDTSLHGDKELLHSDIPEEMKNHNWKQMVRTRPTAVIAHLPRSSIAVK
jgi:GWxTD domain-containing protein